MASPPNPDCAYCERDGVVGEIRLKCQKHYICENCLESKRSLAGTLLSCTSCEQPHPQSSDGIWIYVDDSNIWIEAKKLTSRLKGFKTSQDYRVRIDVGRLTDVVANGRPVAQGFLYGSEPPPLDSVWEKIQEMGWEVDRHKRSRITGKEKKIDTKLVADVTERACTTPASERTTIVVITGDADAQPAIEKVLKYRGWKVEVCMWEQGLSSDLKKLGCDVNSNVEVYSLDGYLSRVTFTNMKFDITKKHQLPQVKSYGVVFTIEENAFRNKVPTKKWISQLESIAQWPFQYYWFEDEMGRQTNDLVVVFRSTLDGTDEKPETEKDAKVSTSGPDRVTETLKKKFNVEDFLEMMKEQLPQYVRSVTTFCSYIDKAKLHQYALDNPGIHSVEDACAGSDNESVYVTESRGPSWQLAKYRHRVHRRQRYSDPCPYKFNCKFGLRCDFKHSKDEENFFSNNNGRGNPVRKTQLCPWYPRCQKKKEDCRYAHGEVDAWCLSCLQQGHFTENCTTKSTSPI